MKAVWIAGLTLAILSILAGGAVWYLYYRQDPYTKAISQLGIDPKDPQALQQYFENKPAEALPEQLTTKFDPTVNPITLRVTQMNKERGEFLVSVMSPEVWRGRELTTRLTCPYWDLRVTSVGSTTPEYVSPKKLPDTIDTLEHKDVIISGVCTDNSCGEIHKACQVSMLYKQ